MTTSCRNYLKVTFIILAFLNSGGGGGGGGGGGTNFSGFDLQIL